MTKVWARTNETSGDQTVALFPTRRYHGPDRKRNLIEGQMKGNPKKSMRNINI